ncbi:MAG: aspartate kinase [Solobacterium sp.]|jgi:aspartate kinase|nr:aspartate kinase [Solobacterium sp.]MCH4222566.1 aspartate kinase [Solobacterium sp.]MCH4265405.1 aspartate kinase [Solobacterium sp.]
MIKVAKFGGSSVANAKQFKKVRKIIREDASRKVVVVSACGKEAGDDHKITDLLYLCEAHIRYGVSWEEIFSMIENRYRSIKEDLNLNVDLETEFAKIRSLMKPDTPTDYLVSRGEYLTALCMAEYLGFEFADAADVIAYQYDGEIDMVRTQQLLQEKCQDGKGIVVPGFYGALPNGVIKVMSRGGSDITGAVLANVMDADVYENWTDVSGFFVADPRIIHNPMQIPRINYSELREMSYMGANILHDDAVFPVREKNIPINVRNTNDPENHGTMILCDCSELDEKDPPHPITGITGRKDFTVITLVKSHTSGEVGYLRKLLAIFEEFHISIESVPVTVDTFSVIVSTESIDRCVYEIAARIRTELKPDDLRVEDHVALVAIVGRGMKEVPGMSGQLLSEFGRNKINIKVISQTSDELCIVVGVMNRDFDKAIKCVYDRFIATEKRKNA